MILEGKYVNKTKTALIKVTFGSQRPQLASDWLLSASAQPCDWHQTSWRLLCSKLFRTFLEPFRTLQACFRSSEVPNGFIVTPRTGANYF